MKKLNFFVFLFSALFGYSQSLPENFEGTITTANFINFDGGTGTVIPNPQISGINTSATVGQIVRNGGQIWAGSKYNLAAALNFSTLSVISMKVYTTAPVGTVVKFKLENAGGANIEINTTTTVSGSWQELAWDFSGTPNIYTTIVLMFDFGNIGNGSAQSTFLFDDIEQDAPTLTQINLPVTFEGSSINYTMTDFGGNASTLIVDPTNPANNVMQIVKGTAAQLWAGTTISTSAGFASAIPFSASATEMSVRVWSPTSGTPIRLKVEQVGSPANSCETQVNTTVAGGWETLVFDFATPITGPALNVGGTYNMASIFFNFGTTGAAAGSQTYYFDDVMFGAPILPPSQINLPVTFESASVDYTMTDFGGNASTLVVDPTNPANNVMQVVKGAAAQLWAGTTISTSAGFASAIPFTVSATQMSVRVWSPTSGTPIRLKVEQVGAPAISCETQVNTTIAGGWETLVFNFASPVSGPALNVANTYNMASIFFNFGTTGGAAGSQTYYFDDVMFGAPPVPLSQINLPVTFESSTVNYTMTDFGGNASMIVVDPTNPANMAMQVVKTGSAQLWAGTTISTSTGFASAIPFVAGSTLMSVRVWSPTAGTPIRLKVEQVGAPAISCETQVNTTIAGGWQTLTFDFSNPISGPALNFGNTYNMASIFFNFGTTGAAAGAQTYYFDDVMFGSLTPPPAQISLPVTFDVANVNYSMTNFGGNVSTMVADPTNPSNMVMQVEKTAGAQVWAGTTIGTSAGFSSAIPFSAGSTYMSVRVWSPTAGTPILLKVEQVGNGAISCETLATTTVAGGWQTLAFNFVNNVPSTPSLNLANTYNLASIFFNFGTNGATAGAQTYYFDDVMFGQPAITPVSPPSNDGVCSALTITPSSGTSLNTYNQLGGLACSNRLTNTIGATATGAVESSCGSANGSSVWYKFTTPACVVGGVVPFQIEVSTDNAATSYDTKIELFSSSNGLCTGTLTSIQCSNNDASTALSGCDGASGVTSTVLRTDLTPSTTYFVLVDGLFGAAGSVEVSGRALVAAPTTTVLSPTQISVATPDRGAALYTYFARQVGSTGYASSNSTSLSRSFTVANGQSYQTQIVSRCTSATSQWYRTPMVVTNIPVAAACTPVSNLSCTPGATGWVISWSEVAGLYTNGGLLSGYQIYYRVIGASGYSLMSNPSITCAGGVCSYAFPGLTNPAGYEFWIKTRCSSTILLQSNTTTCSGIKSSAGDIFSFVNPTTGVEFIDMPLSENWNDFGLEFRDLGDYYVGINKDNEIYAEKIGEANLINFGDDVSFELIPNPTNASTTITFKEAIKAGTFIVLDAMGREILSGDISNTNAVELDGSNWNAGVYLVNVTTNDKTTMRRLVISK